MIIKKSSLEKVGRIEDLIAEILELAQDCDLVSIEQHRKVNGNIPTESTTSVKVDVEAWDGILLDKLQRWEASRRKLINMFDAVHASSFHPKFITWAKEQWEDFFGNDWDVLSQGLEILDGFAGGQENHRKMRTAREELESLVDAFHCDFCPETWRRMLNVGGYPDRPLKATRRAKEGVGTVLGCGDESPLECGFEAPAESEDNAKAPPTPQPLKAVLIATNKEGLSMSFYEGSRFDDASSMPGVKVTVESLLDYCSAFGWGHEVKIERVPVVGQIKRAWLARRKNQCSILIPDCEVENQFSEATPEDMKAYCRIQGCGDVEVERVHCFGGRVVQGS